MSLFSAYFQISSSPGRNLKYSTITLIPSVFSFISKQMKKKRIPKMSYICRQGPSLTDLLKTPHSSLAMHMAHTQCAHFERPLFVRACLCVHSFRFRKLIYYCSHSAPLHARLSIWAVVLTVCSNLLLFNCLTAARPTATPARKKCWASLNKEDGQDAIDFKKKRERWCGKSNVYQTEMGSGRERSNLSWCITHVNTFTIWNVNVLPIPLTRLHWTVNTHPFLAVL